MKALTVICTEYIETFIRFCKDKEHRVAITMCHWPYVVIKHLKRLVQVWTCISNIHTEFQRLREHVKRAFIFYVDFILIK